MTWSIGAPPKPSPEPFFHAHGATALAGRANWSWHEYGNRVGFWRLRDMFKKYGVTPTLAMNGIIIESYPQIVEYAREEGWEFMGHGYIQGPMHKLSGRRHIRSTVGPFAIILVSHLWAGRAGLTETMETLDIWPKKALNMSRTGLLTTNRWS